VHVYFWKYHSWFMRHCHSNETRAHFRNCQKLLVFCLYLLYWSSDQIGWWLKMFEYLVPKKCESGFKNIWNLISKNRYFTICSAFEWKLKKKDHLSDFPRNTTVFIDFFNFVWNFFRPSPLNFFHYFLARSSRELQ
jgi:hypothetical protein